MVPFKGMKQKKREALVCNFGKKRERVQKLVGHALAELFTLSLGLASESGVELVAKQTSRTTTAPSTHGNTKCAHLCSYTLLNST